MIEQKYTPFMTSAGEKIAQGLSMRNQQRQQQQEGQLMGDAMMGDQQSLQNLYMYNPKLAAQVQQRNEAQAAAARQAEMQRKQDLMSRRTQFQQKADSVLQEIGKSGMSYEEAKPYLTSALMPWDDILDVNMLAENEYTPEFHEGALSIYGEKPEFEFKSVRDLTNDVTKVIQPAVEIKAAADSLQQLNKTRSATDQLAAIFKFMKALDPRSVVREGEQEQAVKTGGATDVFLGYIQSLQGGGKLTEETMNNIATTAAQMSDSAAKSVKSDLGLMLDGYGEYVPKDFSGKQMSRIPALFYPDADDLPLVTSLAEFNKLKSGDFYYEIDDVTGEKKRFQVP